MLTSKKNYFDIKSEDEDNPIKIPNSQNKKFKTLEIIVESFFEKNYIKEAKEMSVKERQEKLLVDQSFTYGEVTFRTMAYIFEYVKSFTNIDPKGNFYDFGSGVGKAVFSTVFLYPFYKYIGIEYLDCLYNKSLPLKNKLKKKFLKILDAKEEYLPDYNESKKGNEDSFEFLKSESSIKKKENEEEEEEEDEEDEEKESNNSNKKEEEESEEPIIIRFPKMEFIKGNFLETEVSDASFIFINSTCFTLELMYELSKKLDSECKSGCVVVTFTKKLPLLNPIDWEIKPSFKRIMSWGPASIFIHIRKKDNNEEEEENKKEIEDKKTNKSIKSKSEISKKSKEQKRLKRNLTQKKDNKSNKKKYSSSSNSSSSYSSSQS
jgi:hypothetical protein